MAYRRTDAISYRLSENRRKILNATRELIMEGGFARAQISAVASRAGLATGTLYRYFSSKEELCLQVFREVSSREMSHLNAVANKPTPPRERFIEVIRSFAGRAMTGRRLAYALLAEPVDNALSEERWRFRGTHAAIFQGIIEEGVAEGTFDCADAKLAATCLAGAIPTALTGPLAPDNHTQEPPAQEIIARLTRFCLQSVGCMQDSTDESRALSPETGQDAGPGVSA